MNLMSSGVTLGGIETVWLKSLYNSSGSTSFLVCVQAVFQSTSYQLGTLHTAFVCFNHNDKPSRVIQPTFHLMLSGMDFSSL